MGAALVLIKQNDFNFFKGKVSVLAMPEGSVYWTEEGATSGKIHLMKLYLAEITV